MQNSPARAAAPSHVPSVKVPRERVVRLAVETEICPQVLLRVLGLLAQRWIVPLTISAQRSDESMRLEVEIEVPADGDYASLVAKIEEVVMVRSARII
ncbi:MAG: hypothetical protein KF730_03410 [Sphingomonas sp.]|uniref:hypothetical protein n=1 Tax=Sphingomonas sp. TaxID=28214 RepID=UPI0025CD212C|nr:hypothetical protein [Sphingomonas sp.]MBX3563606.1 hypothetical protein [Sphingomonas sp.]